MSFLIHHNAHHYVQQARRIAMKVRLKLPRTLRRQFCKHCLHYLKPGVNARVRTRKDAGCLLPPLQKIPTLCFGLNCFYWPFGHILCR